MKRIRNYFLTGLLVTGPAGITLYLVWALISWVDDRVKPLIPRGANPETYLPFVVPGLGVVFAFIALTLIGFLTANIVGRTLLRAGDFVVGRLPVVRTVYRLMKQIFESVFAVEGKGFRKVALIEFPRKGTWSIVFLASDVATSVKDKLEHGEDVVAAFMPTAPNPTNGFLVYVQREEVIYLDMSVEDAAKLIISCGLVNPDMASAAAAAAKRRRKTEPSDELPPAGAEQPAE